MSVHMEGGEGAVGCTQGGRRVGIPWWKVGHRDGWCRRGRWVAYYLGESGVQGVDIVEGGLPLKQCNHGNQYVVCPQLEHLKLKLDEMSQDHNKQKVSINSQLARLQENQETKTDSNQEKELNFALTKGDLRKRVGSLLYKHRQYLTHSKQICDRASLDFFRSVNDYH